MIGRTRVVVALLVFLGFGTKAGAAGAPDDLPRMEICLNGAWETVLDAEAEKIPTAGWSLRRAPGMPLATDPRTTSVWYRHRIRIPGSWIRPKRRFFFRLEKVGHYAAVYWNGARVAEHHGQYTPFETDVTNALRPGEENEIAVFVHGASGRPGANLTDPFEGNAYRGATMDEPHRNWVGIAGDIFLAWRPATAVSDVFVVPSVRRRHLAARIETTGSSSNQPLLEVRGVVLDEGRAVLSLGQARTLGNETTLEADWRDPVLWGPPSRTCRSSRRRLSESTG